MELNRTGIIDRLKAGARSIDDFNYDKLSAPPLSMLLTQHDIDKLYNIATSVRYAGNLRKKYKAIDEILKARDFIKLSAGTNRLCYKFRHDDSFVIKAAYDAIAIQDSPAEFMNQFILKPFCSKVFEVDPCGVVGSFERVDPITSREEFASIADDAYYLMNDWLVANGHIMADIGTKYFMNYGLRRGFGLVIIDFPYLYEIDGNKIFCTSPDNKSATGVCGGIIDFDAGFNNLYCEKCGTRYRVKEIAKEVKEGKIIIKDKKGGNKKMKLKIMVGGRDITERDERIDGFRPEATKVSRPANRGDNVAVRTVVKPSESDRRNDRQRRSANVKTSISHSARQDHHQAKRNDGYTRPNGNPTEKKEQQEMSSRPLPERNDQKVQKNDAADSRGKTVVNTAIGAAEAGRFNFSSHSVQDPSLKINQNDRHIVTPESVTLAAVTAEEASYVMTDDGNVPVSDETGAAEAKEKADAEIKELTALNKDLAMELEQTKFDLETAESKLEIANGSLANEQERNKKLSSIINTNNATIETYEKSVKELNEAIETAQKQISERNHDIDKLNEMIVELREELNKKTEAKVDLDEYVPIKDHESLMADIGARNEEMHTTIRKLAEDLYDFCDFTLEVEDHLIKPCGPDENFNPEVIEGVSNVDATICRLSDLITLGVYDEDRYVFALNYGDASYLSSASGKFVIVSTINGTPLDQFVAESTSSYMNPDLYEKYFSETIEDGEKEVQEQQEEQTERVEGEVVKE